MSRKAANSIPLPQGVTVDVKGSRVTVKGPKGELVQEFRPGIEITVNDGAVRVTQTDQEAKTNFLGLTWALVSNMVHGVAQGFQKKLEMIGVGFRAAVQGDKLDLQVGFSHPTKMAIPEGLKVGVEKNTLITVEGTDKQVVGQFAADIRAKRPPEPYKGKGIRYVDEYVRRKAGKAGKGSK